ncbi:MAG: hypothetical protein LBK94_05265 [Prevotellaceae bacterium]|jgi:hypothetical protein|nr:hypothetical protein [Prevotellaceae bacterium]
MENNFYETEEFKCLAKILAKSVNKLFYQADLSYIIEFLYKKAEDALSDFSNKHINNNDNEIINISKGDLEDFIADIWDFFYLMRHIVNIYEDHSAIRRAVKKTKENEIKAKGN